MPTDDEKSELEMLRAFRTSAELTIFSLREERAELQKKLKGADTFFEEVAEQLSRNRYTTAKKLIRDRRKFFPVT